MLFKPQTSYLDYCKTPQRGSNDSAQTLGNLYECEGQMVKVKCAEIFTIGYICYDII